VEFAELDGEDWLPINDVVMGGISTGRMFQTGHGTAVFTGSVSLERNGGFSSVRSVPYDHDLRGCSGVALRVLGDDHRYKFNLKMGRSHESFVFQAPFDAPARAWCTVLLPFADFVPRVRGRAIENAPELDPSRVSSIGFVIADRQAGLFRLEIGWIKGYRD
jgi:monofunctional biosynthetic peptidoglycan transglycosylase